MRHPVFTRFAAVSFVALSGLAIACAKSEDPDLFGPATEVAKTDPEEDAGSSKKLPPKTQKITPVQQKPVEDAGTVPDASPPAEPEEPEEPEPENCPDDMAHYTSALMASASGTANFCPGGGSDCSTGECCYVNALIPAMSMCIPE